MARYNEILTGRHNRFLQKLFSMKGGPPSPQLSSEIQVIHPIFHGVENRFIESWNRYWTFASSGAQAAINSAIQMRNPAGSNIIIVLESLNVRGGAGNNIDVSGTHAGITGDLTNVVAGLTMDFRNTSNSTAVVSASVGATGDLALLFQAYNFDTAMKELILTHDQEIVLFPGDVLRIVNQTVNTVMTGNFRWRERILEDSERTL